MEKGIKKLVLIFLVFSFYWFFNEVWAGPISDNDTVPNNAVSPDFLGDLADLLRTIAIVGATVMIVIGGFQWMTSLGDSGKVGAAKEKIYSAIFGLLIVALAEIIAGLLR